MRGGHRALRHVMRAPPTLSRPIQNSRIGRTLALTTYKCSRTTGTRALSASYEKAVCWESADAGEKAARQNATPIGSRTRRRTVGGGMAWLVQAPCPWAPGNHAESCGGLARGATCVENSSAALKITLRHLGYSARASRCAPKTVALAA